MLEKAGSSQVYRKSANNCRLVVVAVVAGGWPDAPSQQPAPTSTRTAPTNMQRPPARPPTHPPTHPPKLLDQLLPRQLLLPHMLLQAPLVVRQLRLLRRMHLRLQGHGASSS
jgi:hypothetical protein